jgi:hypothetical protein
MSTSRKQKEQNEFVVESLSKRLKAQGYKATEAAKIAKAVLPVVKKLTTIAEKQKIAEAAQLEVEKVEAENEAPVTEVEAAEVEVPTALAHLSKAVPGEVLPVEGAIGASLLQKQWGRNSGASYVVAAVKKENGIVSVRDLGSDSLKVRFYPNMAFWEVSYERMQAFGAHSFLNRGDYDRLLINHQGFQHIAEVLISQSEGATNLDLSKRFQVAIPEAVEEILTD